MMFTAAGITDFTKHTFKIAYDPAKLEVVDLCSQTAKLDTTVGAVPGSNKTITVFNSSTGIIEFTMSNPSSLTKSWAGIVSSIKFKSKVTGNANITYTIQ